MNIAKQIAEELKIKVWQVEAVMELIDEGCTIPFIARYRKEKHGSLNDEQLRNLDERLTYLRNTVRNVAPEQRLQKKKGWKDWQIRFFCSC